MTTSAPTPPAATPGAPGFVGPPDPPGTVVVPDLDGGRMRVRPELLRRYAKQAVAEGETTIGLRPVLDRARLSGSPFGLLPAAHEVQVAYHGRIEAAWTEIGELADLLETFGERVAEAATGFEKQDEEAAAQLAFQAGRLADKVVCR